MTSYKKGKVVYEGKYTKRSNFEFCPYIPVQPVQHIEKPKERKKKKERRKKCESGDCSSERCGKKVGKICLPMFLICVLLRILSFIFDDLTIIFNIYCFIFMVVSIISLLSLIMVIIIE